MIREKRVSNLDQSEVNLVYRYDASGAIIGLTYHPSSGTATLYFFGKNAQGDVVCIYNASGTTVARYNYDAWGACTVAYDNTSIGIANINPIRYRSYYYDAETSLYYLQSRYYDPAVGRFISPDDASYLGANGDLLAYNLYAYCSNNPVNYSDPSGQLAITTVAIIIGATIGFGISAASSVLVQLEEHDGDWSKINLWEVAFDGFFGALNGGLAASGINIWWSMGLGATLGFTSSVGKDYLFNNKQINWYAAFNSFVIGCIGGAIAGAGANYAKDGMQVVKFGNSLDILRRTIANGTQKAIARQTNALNIHATQLLISGVRYMLANTFSIAYTMHVN